MIPQITVREKYVVSYVMSSNRIKRRHKDRIPAMRRLDKSIERKF